jgi:hypothetical protein
MMHALVIISLVGSLLFAALAIIFVHRMASDLLRLASAEERKSWPLSQIRGIIREHGRFFPASQTMLGFWLTLEYFVISLVCIVYGAIFAR